METIGAFFQYIVDFLVAIADFFTQAFVFFIAKLTIWYWELKISSVKMVYSIASQVLADVNVSSYLASAFSNSDLMQLATSCRIPEAINIVLSAMLTKFILRFLGW